MTLIKQTLVSADGRASRKSLILMVSFFVTIFLAVWIVICEPVTKTPIDDSAVSVFNSLLFFVTALTGITVADKKMENKQPK